MLLLCVETGEKTYLNHILPELMTNTLKLTYEILQMNGRVCLKKKGNKKRPISSVANYYVNLEKATQQCKDILRSAPYEETDLDKNIFCPYHENRRFSKTPSARLYMGNNSFVCFSTRCKKKCTSIQLLRFLIGGGK